MELKTRLPAIFMYVTMRKQMECETKEVVK